jgi:ribonuclease BN (tRNA processing enzyme)
VTPKTLRFLGAGSAFSRLYGTTCSVLTLTNGKRWLIDCGRQAPDQIHDAGLSWHVLEGQIVTHHHGDHSYGLEDFAFMRYYESHDGLNGVRMGGPRPKMIAHSAVEAELYAFLAPSIRFISRPDGTGTDGTLEDFFEMIRASAHEAPRDNPWRHSESFSAEGLSMIARESEHVPDKPSCSLEIGIEGDPVGGRIAWWSGDSTVDAEQLNAIADRTTVFFHDCTFTDYPGQVHGAFRLLCELPESIRKKMVLMHHDDDIEDHRAEVEAAGFRLAFPGQLYDLASGKLIEG